MGSHDRDSIPLAVAVAGAILVVSAALPLAPSGASFVDIARRAFAADPLQGVVTMLGFGSPYLFGGATALLRIFGGHEWARSAVRITVSLMAGQLLLVSALLVRHGLGLHAKGLLGFAVVGTAYFLYHSARSRAQAVDDGPPMRFVVRWGALFVLGVGSWLRLQWVDEVFFGPAVDAAWLCAGVMLWTMRPRSPVDGGAERTESPEPSKVA